MFDIHVRRYYNAWIETYTEEQFKKHSGVDLSLPSDVSFSESSDEDIESCDSGSTSEEDSHNNTGDAYNLHCCVLKLS